MIEINKKECEYLEKNGAVWKKDLHKTYSSGHKLFMTESPKLLKLLDFYRNSKG